MVAVEILEYVDARSRSPYRDWVLNLDAVAAARISSAVLRIGVGNFSLAKSVGSGVHELRLDLGRAIECTSARTAKDSSFCYAAVPRNASKPTS
jgi:putative component of toxin-antitoxin plasmid stabilization module